MAAAAAAARLAEAQQELDARAGQLAEQHAAAVTDCLRTPVGFPRMAKVRSPPSHDFNIPKYVDTDIFRVWRLYVS